MPRLMRNGGNVRNRKSSGKTWKTLNEDGTVVDVASLVTVAWWAGDVPVDAVSVAFPPSPPKLSPLAGAVIMAVWWAPPLTLVLTGKWATGTSPSAHQCSSEPSHDDSDGSCERQLPMLHAMRCTAYTGGASGGGR
jgi:hypothetical protein